MRSWRWALGAAAVVGLFAAAAGPAVAGSAPAQPRSTSSQVLSTKPVFPGDFADPDLVRVPGGYVAYATGSAGTNLQVMTSADLHTWTMHPDPLPVLPVWAEFGLTWAPGVVQLGDRWVMYYTAHRRATNTQCIGVATAATPTGPFTDPSRSPLICQPPGSIDASPYVAFDQTPYLVWKSDDNSSPGVRTRLWSQRLAPDGRSLLGSPSLLLEADAPWQATVIEGPTMVRDGAVELLVYGGAHWNTAQSGIGYATCASPTGPCLNASITQPWMRTDGRVVGPQGPSFFTDWTGKPHMAYAAWTGPVGYHRGGRRTLWIDPVAFTGGAPALGS